MTHVCVEIPSRYLDQCRCIVNWIIRKTFQWSISVKLDSNYNKRHKENRSENGVCKMATILSSPQCIKFKSVSFITHRVWSYEARTRNNCIQNYISHYIQFQFQFHQIQISIITISVQFNAGCSAILEFTPISIDSSSSSSSYDSVQLKVIIHYLQQYLRQWNDILCNLLKRDIYILFDHLY